MNKILVVLTVVIMVLPSLSSAQTATDVVCAGCVSSTDLATNAVTSAKILLNAVTSTKIADGTIVNADISSTAAISASKISGTAWTGSNDGSGSTLDADYLDSFTSSQFLRSDTAGTLTGNLTLTNPSAGAELRVDGNGGTYGLYLGADSNFPYIGSRTDSDLRLVTNSVEKVRITSGGNVGIGITSPGAKLAVVAGADTWAGSFFGLDTSNQVRLGTYGGVATIGANNSTGSAWANLALNPGGGNVGIGTTTPSAKLDVYGDAATINVGSSTDTEHGIKITPEGSTERAYLYTTGGNSDHAGHLRLSNGGSDRTTADIALRNDAGTTINYITNSGDSYLNGGNVGIGTTSPTTTLDVAGNFALSGSQTVGDQMVWLSPGSGMDHGDFNVVGSIAWYVVQFGSTGGTIYLQPGTYTVSSQAIPLADNIAIIGSGPSSVIAADASLQDDVINNESVSIGAAGVDNVTLRDFQVVGNGYTNWVSGDTTGGDYQDCIDIGGSTTEADYNTNITLSGLIVSHCGRHGIIVKHTQELAMSDLFLHDNGTGVYHHNIYLSDINNAMLSNIESEGAAGTGIKITQADHATLSNFIAHGNVEYGIRVDGDSGNVTINSSSAYSNGISGFILTTDVSSAHDITLNGCAAYQNTENGVEVNDANNTVISGCTIRDNSVDGIHLDNADRVAITGNMIYSNTTYGVNINSSSSDSLLVGNVNTGNGTDVGGTGSFSVQDNNL